MNAVAPGLIETELHAANGEPGRLERLSPGIPMKCAGTAREVAEGVAWLHRMRLLILLGQFWRLVEGDEAEERAACFNMRTI